MLLTIFVPWAASTAAAIVAPHSAVVGDRSQAEDGFVVCHYEGGIYRQSGLEKFYMRLCHAAGRLTARYPTSAMCGFVTTEIVPVGIFDARRQVVTEIINSEALEAWSGEPVLEIQGAALPPGEVAWNEATALAQGPAIRTLGPIAMTSNNLWFRTQAGQVIAFETKARKAFVFNYDDPGLPARLEQERVELSQIDRRLIFG